LSKHPGLLRSRNSHARVTFVELFFDLVFVFAVTQLSHMLAEHLTLAGALQTLFLLLSVWWVWMYTCWFTNWIDPDKPSVRILMFLLMLAGLLMSAAIPNAFGHEGLLFAIAYAFIQVVRSAFMVVESTEKPVKIEVEILQERATNALLEASRHASMLCIGAVGPSHDRGDPVGSTAAMLASAAQCPVAVVRGHDPHPARSGWVVAEIGDSAAAGEVLRHAYDEARLRRAPLRVVTTWQSLYVDIHDNLAASDRQKLAKAKIDRRLAKWERSYPDVDMRAAAVHCNSRAYLTKNADSIQLLVVGRERADGIRELVGPPGSAALHHANCSVLICGPHTVL